ncbi:RNA polymerase sigma-70 factor (ECF subfamily) [Kribbella rubisoli]|uniref:RNA polymerase sigma-70 factor (ECF subfamily) n=1 Tax=Kribbella rubisoli TaxID=3075929 RepID=A0A4V2G086_9ACTN|nr:RNA polymerase sigma-70 factor (ECF subfamily) [Kribbella rubisoli]
MILQEFESARGMLAGLAYRLLGSWHDAEDVLQDAYVRWSAADRTDVAEPRRYLTRVVTRLSVDVLRTRQARRESYAGEWLPEPVSADALELEDLSMALLHLMERLTPPQRAVYVLRTAFTLPYDDIAEILDRTPEHCRQLHRRAVQGLDLDRARFEPTIEEQQRLLLDFVAAARDGDLVRLEAMLKDSVTSWTDGGGVRRAARKPVVGRAKVAQFFTHIYGRPALSVVPLDLVTGPALDVQIDGRRHVLVLDVDAGQIAGIRVVASPAKLSALDDQRRS